MLSPILSAINKLLQSDEVQCVFDLFDTNNEGRISAANAAEAFRTIGKAPTQAELTAALGSVNSIDFNQSSASSSQASWRVLPLRTRFKRHLACSMSAATDIFLLKN